jgi:hypothetical protein
VAFKNNNGSPVLIGGFRDGNPYDVGYTSATSGWSNDPISPHEWVHVVMTIDSESFKIYKDGEL